MIGARIGLRVAPEMLSRNDRPRSLNGVYGTVARLPEQVISPQSFLQDLATQYHDRILKIDADQGLKFELDSPGEVTAVHLKSPSDGTTLELRPRHVIFTAGGGNARLRKRVGLSGDVMQRRPLHMVMVRGDLPELNGHCLDGARTRVTITSDRDQQGRMVWQIGGQVAEDGVKLDPGALTEFTWGELLSVLPAVDLRDTEWSTYSVDRAEGATANGSRPETIQVLCAGNVTTGWPTKLVLAPVLANEIASRASSPYVSDAFDTKPFANWPRPAVADVPWESAECRWWKLGEAPALPRRRAA